jgi:plasmid stability protein
MASVTIETLDDVVLRKISDRAASNNRSLAMEIDDIVRATLSSDEKAAGLRSLADDLARRVSTRPQSDSVVSLFEDRQR